MSGDLSGHWSGFYNYPGEGPPVRFDTDLRESSGRLTGTTTESSDLPDRCGETLHAVIDGHREGLSVSFLKMYEADDDHDVVHYQGTLHVDGNEIEGRWDIPGIWSGTFLMVRASGLQEEVIVAEEAPVGFVR